MKERREKVRANVDMALALVLLNVGVEPGCQRDDDIACHEQDAFEPVCVPLVS